MRAIQGVAMATGLLWATTADAHWQNTRWGMNEAEVRAVWPTAREREEGGQYLLKMDGPVSVGGLTYETVRFVFDTRGKLREVRLDVAQAFEPLRERMASQLGAPVSDEDRSVFMPEIRNKAALFRDTAKGNAVKLWSITSGVGSEKSFLTYKPLETGF
jgi:hypothetical protein